MEISGWGEVYAAYAAKNAILQLGRYAHCTCIWKTKTALTHEIISTCQRCEYEMPQLDQYVTQQQLYVTEMSHSALIAWATFAH